MAKNLVSPKSVDELREVASVTKLKIALLELQEAELDNIEKRIDIDVDLNEYLEHKKSSMVRRISRGTRISHTKAFIYDTIPRLIRVSACLLLCCYISLSVAIAANSTIRIKITNYISSIGERYTSYGFEDSGMIMDVPIEWEGFYYPAYIPAGLTLSHVASENVTYTSGNGTLFEFDDMNSGTNGTLDTEDASIEFLTINGRSAMLVEKEQWTTILWNVDNRILLVGYTGGRDETIRIAESVRMIR